MASPGSLGSSYSSSYGTSGLGGQTSRPAIETTIERCWQFDHGQHKSKCRPEAVEYMEERLRQLAKSREPQAGDDQVRQEAISRLQGLLSLVFPPPSQLQLVPYGSFLSSCYSHGSDLDLALSGVVDERLVATDPLQLLYLPPGKNVIALSKLVDEQWVMLLRRLADALEQQGVARGPVTRILEARVPIIKFIEVLSGIECDICVTTRGCDFKGAVMRQLHLLQPSLAPLIRLVKLWAKQHDINSAHHGTLNSWSLALMALFSLQSYPGGPLLPPLWRLFHEEEPSGPGGAGRPLQDKTMPLDLMLDVASKRCREEGPQLLRSRSAPPPETQSPGLLDLLLWFLSSFTAITGQWRDNAAHRNWRVSPWLGRGYTARFPKAYVAAVEEPFDSNDNTARSVGIRERNENTLPYIAWVFGHSVHLLRNVQSTADATRTIAWLFGPDALPILGLQELKVPPGSIPAPLLEKLTRKGRSGPAPGAAAALAAGRQAAGADSGLNRRPSGSGVARRSGSGGGGGSAGQEPESESESRGEEDEEEAALRQAAFRALVDAAKLGSPIMSLEEWRHHQVLNRSKPPHAWHRMPPTPPPSMTPAGGRVSANGQAVNGLNANGGPNGHHPNQNPQHLQPGGHQPPLPPPGPRPPPPPPSSAGRHSSLPAPPQHFWTPPSDQHPLQPQHGHAPFAHPQAGGGGGPASGGPYGRPPELHSFHSIGAQELQHPQHYSQHHPPHPHQQPHPQQQQQQQPPVHQPQLSNEPPPPQQQQQQQHPPLPQDFIHILQQFYQLQLQQQQQPISQQSLQQHFLLQMQLEQQIAQHMERYVKQGRSADEELQLVMHLGRLMELVKQQQQRQHSPYLPPGLMGPGAQSGAEVGLGPQGHGQGQLPGLGLGPGGLGLSAGGVGGGLGAAGGFGHLGAGGSDVRQLVAALQGNADGVAGASPPPQQQQQGAAWSNGGVAASIDVSGAAAAAGGGGVGLGGGSAGQALLEALRAGSAVKRAADTGERSDAARAAAAAALARVGLMPAAGAEAATPSAGQRAGAAVAPPPGFGPGLGFGPIADAARLAGAPGQGPDAGSQNQTPLGSCFPPGGGGQAYGGSHQQQQQQQQQLHMGGAWGPPQAATASSSSAFSATAAADQPGPEDLQHMYELLGLVNLSGIDGQETTAPPQPHRPSTTVAVSMPPSSRAAQEQTASTALLLATRGSGGGAAAGPGLAGPALGAYQPVLRPAGNSQGGDAQNRWGPAGSASSGSGGLTPLGSGGYGGGATAGVVNSGLWGGLDLGLGLGSGGGKQHPQVQQQQQHTQGLQQQGEHLQALKMPHPQQQQQGGRPEPPPGFGPPGFGAAASRLPASDPWAHGPPSAAPPQQPSVTLWGQLQ